MYEMTTRGIRVSVNPEFLEDQSDPGRARYIWAYTIRIDNESDDTVQLRERFWRITNSNGQMDEVQGDGVVGEQPVLQPGEGFEYTSGAPLSTPAGMMSGHYKMRSLAGDLFDVNIPAFSLDSPHELRLLN